MANYSFIDMHIHSSYSNEENCLITVEEILAKAQKKAQIAGKDCVISISDHNSILGVVEARKILCGGGSDNYPNVKLINGIEFTTDLIETNSFFNNTRTLTRCHMLGYNYDENDPELIAYSKITHKMFSMEDNTGLQICAARRAVCEKYGIYIPFSVYETMANLSASAKFRSIFLTLTKNYLTENNISFDPTALRELVEPYISNEVEYVRNSTSFGRLKLSEVAKLIKDAHGELVLAHPSLLRFTVDGLREIAQQNGMTLEDFYVISNLKYGNNTDLAHVKNRKIIINSILNTFTKICGYPISGFETYYLNNFSSRLDKTLEDVAEQHNMYVTCGSDYHGELLHPDKSIGCFFHPQILSKFKKEYYPLEATNDVISLSSLPIVEHFLQGKDMQDKTTATFGNHLGQEILKSTMQSFLEDYYSDFKEKNSQNHIQEIKNSLMLSTRVQEIQNVLTRLDAYDKNSNSAKKRAKIMLRLNLYAENILEAMRKLKTSASTHEFIRQEPEYYELIDLMKTLRTRFARIVHQNPNIVKQIKSDMKYYYGRKSSAIAYLAQMNLDPPITETSTPTTNTENTL